MKKKIVVALAVFLVLALVMGRVAIVGKFYNTSRENHMLKDSVETLRFELKKCKGI